MDKIKLAVLQGKTVYWMNENYQVIHDKILNEFLVHSKGNNNYVGLNSYYREYEFKVVQAWVRQKKCTKKCIQTGLTTF